MSRRLRRLSFDLSHWAGVHSLNFRAQWIARLNNLLSSKGFLLAIPLGRRRVRLQRKKRKPLQRKKRNTITMLKNNLGFVLTDQSEIREHITQHFIIAILYHVFVIPLHQNGVLLTAFSLLSSLLMQHS